MKTENKMMKQLESENISIFEHKESSHSFAFGYENQIFIPKEKDINSLESQFSLAHELGHIYQFNNSGFFKKRANTYCRKNTVDCGILHSLLFSLFLLWIELDAWIKGYFILKEENISAKGYINHAWKCYKTYLKSEIIKSAKYFLPFYPAFTILGWAVTKNINWSTFWLDSVIVYFLMLAIYELCNLIIASFDTCEMKFELLVTKVTRF